MDLNWYEALANWISLHPHAVLMALPVLWALNGAISAMPTPESNRGFYRWFFDFVHYLAGLITRIAATREALKTKNSLPLSIMMSAPPLRSDVVEECLPSGHTVTGRGLELGPMRSVPVLKRVIAKG